MNPQLIIVGLELVGKLVDYLAMRGDPLPAELLERRTELRRELIRQAVEDAALSDDDEDIDLT